MAESFFATLKNELIYHHPWPTQARAKTAVITWIEGRYNGRRRRSAWSPRSSLRPQHDTLPPRQRDPCPHRGVRSSVTRTRSAAASGDSPICGLSRPTTEPISTYAT